MKPIAIGSLVFMFVTSLSWAQINTFTLSQASLQAAFNQPFGNCLNYKVVGLCFWLVCSWRGCGIRPTLKIQHYLPDVITVAYRATASKLVV